MKDFSLVSKHPIGLARHDDAKVLHCASFENDFGDLWQYAQTWEDHPKLNYHINMQFGERVAHMALQLIDS